MIETIVSSATMIETLKRMIMKFYNDKFRAIREQKKVKLTELAEKMQLNRNTLWLWESGSTQPPEKTVKFVAKLLNISVDEISDLKPDAPISESLDASHIGSMLSSVASVNVHDQENIQSYFLNKLHDQFKELNSIVSLVSTFLNSIPLICYAKDVFGKYTIVNEAFLENVSLGKNFKAVGKSDSDFFSGKEAKENKLEDERIILTGEAIIDREDFIPGSRKNKWGLISKIPIFDGAKNIVGMVGYFIDITQRKKAENKVKAFVNALNMMDESIWIAREAREKPEGGILFDNFLYSVHSGLMKKIFQGKSTPTIKEMYELSQSMILGYEHKEQYTVEMLKKSRFLEMRLNIKGLDEKTYSIKNKIYYDSEHELFVTLTSEDSEKQVIEKIVQNLRKSGIDEKTIKEATDVL